MPQMYNVSNLLIVTVFIQQFKKYSENLCLINLFQILKIFRNFRDLWKIFSPFPESKIFGKM